MTDGTSGGGPTTASHCARRIRKMKCARRAKAASSGSTDDAASGKRPRPGPAPKGSGAVHIARNGSALHGPGRRALLLLLAFAAEHRDVLPGQRVVGDRDLAVVGVDDGRVHIVTNHGAHL